MFLWQCLDCNDYQGIPLLIVSKERQRNSCRGFSLQRGFIFVWLFVFSDTTYGITPFYWYRTTCYYICGRLCSWGNVCDFVWFQIIGCFAFTCFPAWSATEDHWHVFPLSSFLFVSFSSSRPFVFSSWPLRHLFFCASPLPFFVSSVLLVFVVVFLVLLFSSSLHLFIPFSSLRLGTRSTLHFLRQVIRNNWKALSITWILMEGLPR